METESSMLISIVSLMMMNITSLLMISPFHFVRCIKKCVCTVLICHECNQTANCHYVVDSGYHENHWSIWLGKTFHQGMNHNDRRVISEMSLLISLVFYHCIFTPHSNQKLYRVSWTVIIHIWPLFPSPLEEWNNTFPLPCNIFNASVNKQEQISLCYGV